MAYIISADEIKKQLPYYSPDKAGAFHRESAKQADRLFTKALKKNSSEEVILLCGGAASGKTEFLSTQLIQKSAIIFDATLSTKLGAKNKLRQIFKSKKIPVLYAIIPDDLKRAFIAFLNRDRKFSDEHFYKTHAGSRRTLLWLVSEYTDTEVNIIESSYTSDEKLQFLEVQFNNREKLVDYLKNKQMTENDIINVIKE